MSGRLTTQEKITNRIDQAQMCFILGMGRSGTTLLTNLLNQHPEIVAMPENNFVLFGKELSKLKGKKLLDAYRKLHEMKHNHSLSIWKPDLDFLNEVDIDSITYEDLCKFSYLSSCPTHKINNIEIIIDKNPIYSLYVDDLKRLFPEAKFIVISRDPRDNFVSRKKHTKGIVSNWTIALASSWKLYYDAIFKASAKYKKDFHFVRYEDLTLNSLEEMNKIQQFLCTSNKLKILNPDATLIEDQVNASALSTDNKVKVLEMHHRLKENTNQDRVDIWEGKLNDKEIWFIAFFCKVIGDKFGYQINSGFTIFSFYYILLLLLIYPIHLLTHQLYFFVFYDLSISTKFRIFR